MMGAIIGWLLTTQVGRAVGVLGLCALLFFGGRLWLSWHDESVRDAARAGYVLQSQAEAAEAKLAEVQRQVAAGQIVIASYQEILKNARAKDAADDLQFAKDRKDFEAKLAAAGRSCQLDQSDLDWLSK
jgi:hypothetical protein